jgi:hypothetical protein
VLQPSSSAASSELGSQVDERIGRATKQLQKDLQGEQLEIHATLGEGGFGTVYKGACSATHGLHVLCVQHIRTWYNIASELSRDSESLQQVAPVVYLECKHNNWEACHLQQRVSKWMCVRY